MDTKKIIMIAIVAGLAVCYSSAITAMFGHGFTQLFTILVGSYGIGWFVGKITHPR